MNRRNFLTNLSGFGLLPFVDSDGFFQTAIAEPSYLIHQFEDKGLAHFSYAIVAAGKMVVIDPKRNPQDYYDFASKHNATIIGIIETHPHADFVSAHLEMHQKLNIPVYTSSHTKPAYPITAFDDGQVLKLSENVHLRSIFTPGHAPDHISAVLVADGSDKAVFSGDSLFIGDVGRPDLLDYSAESDRQRAVLAGMMYDTIHEKFAKLKDDVILYPAHGAGSLCGKSIRKAASSTIGYERQHNYAFEKRSKEEFVNLLLSDQPFIPAYFAYDVALNRKGAPAFVTSVSQVKRLTKNFQPTDSAVIIDTRPGAVFKTSHLQGAINIQGTGALETWLGTLVTPETKFYLVASDDTSLEQALHKTAAIGYEQNIEGAFVYDAKDGIKSPSVNLAKVGQNNNYTYLDVRTAKEVKNQPVIKNSLHIPLQELDKRLGELPTDKPVVVYCGSGFRSSAAASLLNKKLPGLFVFDLGPDVSKFMK